ncbi:MAG: hypothetical protein L0H96_19640 [Humibacillus sp.]|nr:hypothetical protein [Humibacillus sp.]MDN5779110.1 hypothetical protein [Humibacillus sp.]
MTIRRQNLLFLLVMLVAADALYGLGLLGTGARGADSSLRSGLGEALASSLPFYALVHVVALFVVAIAWMAAEDGEVGRTEQLDRIEAAARERSQP